MASLGRIQTREYLGTTVRFVDVGGEWWAVGKDVCDALGYENSRKALAEHIKPDDKGVAICYTLGGNQKLTVINEKGIYRLIFRSKLPAAEKFQDWVCDVLVELRKAAGLESIDALRLVDVQVQKDLMARIKAGLKGDATKLDYIKANTIADKAASNKWGFAKMLNKGEMPSEMLADREQALNDTVELIVANRRFGLGLHVSEVIYKMHRINN